MKEKKYCFQPAVRFLLSYLLVLCVPLALALRMWASTERMAYDSAYESTQTLLIQSCHVIDQNLHSLWNYVLQVQESTISSGYYTLADMRANGESVADYRQSMATLPKFINGNLPASVAVYSVKGDCVMSKSGIVPRSDYIFSEPNRLGHEHWLLSILPNRYSYSYVRVHEDGHLSGGESGDYLLMAHSVLGKKNVLIGNILLYINAGDILSLAGFTNENDYAFAYILDEQGNTLVSYDAAGDALPDPAELADLTDGHEIRSIGSQEYLLVCVDQSEYGWRYVAATPLSLIRQRVNGLLQSILLLMIVLALLGVALVMYLSWKNARPLGRLLRVLDPLDGDLPDYEHLDHAVSGLIENSAALKAELVRQQPGMRAALFARWLHGEFKEWPHLEQEFSRIGITLGNGPYAVVILGFESVRPVDARNSNRAIIKTLLREEFPELIDLYEMDFSSMTFVAECQSPDKTAFPRQLERRIGEFGHRIQQRLEVVVTFAGSLAEKPSDVPIAYGEAQSAFEHRGSASEDQAIIWYDAECQPGRQAVVYPIELEMRLMECMAAGDSDSVARIMNKLRWENAVGSAMEMTQFKQLLRMLQATMLRIFHKRSQDAAAYNASIQQVLGGLGESPTAEAYNRIENIFLSACHDIAEENRLRGQRLGLRIEQYVDANWRDPQLSLRSLADHMGYTVTYMSRIFKEEMGELFSVYVEKRRMEEAGRLLSTGGLSVEEVASATGYASAQVFRRAFRRQYACTPAEYAAQGRSLS